MSRMRTRKLAIVAAAPVVERRKPTYDEALQSIELNANHDLEYAQKNLDEFVVRFQKDPAHALEWSKGSFDEAARRRVAELILVMIAEGREPTEYGPRDSKLIMEELQKRFHEETLRRARYPEHSTSPTSNYMSQCLMAQYAVQLEKLERYSRAIENWKA